MSLNLKITQTNKQGYVFLSVNVLTFHKGQR